MLFLPQTTIITFNTMTEHDRPEPNRRKAIDIHMGALRQAPQSRIDADFAATIEEAFSPEETTLRGIRSYMDGASSLFAGASVDAKNILKATGAKDSDIDLLQTNIANFIKARERAKLIAALEGMNYSERDIIGVLEAVVKQDEAEEKEDRK